MANETKEQEFLKDYIALCQKHGKCIFANPAGEQYVSSRNEEELKSIIEQMI